MPLLTQNRELRPHLIWNWSIPALSVKLDDGRRISTCPSAGICARYCYARNGTYLFSNVLAAHTRNLRLVIDETDRWEEIMLAELREPRFTKRRLPRFVPIDDDVMLDDWMGAWIDRGSPAIRIHDSGDFFEDWYLDRWISIAEKNPDLLFYAYTKEIRMMLAANLPENFRWLASTGGTQDDLIDDSMRHAEVFPDQEKMIASGYIDQSANDLLCVILPTKKIGIPANNIPHFTKRMAGRTFGQIQRSLGNIGESG